MKKYLTKIEDIMDETAPGIMQAYNVFNIITTAPQQMQPQLLIKYLLLYNKFKSKSGIYRKQPISSWPYEQYEILVNYFTKYYVFPDENNVHLQLWKDIRQGPDPYKNLYETAEAGLFPYIKPQTEVTDADSLLCEIDNEQYLTARHILSHPRIDMRTKAALLTNLYDSFGKSRAAQARFLFMILRE